MVVQEYKIYKKEPVLKRPFDIFLSGIGLILSAFFWVLIWMLIIIEDGRPVFIRQIRVGKGGRLFTLWKFRSMKKSTLGEKLYRQATENDTRITIIGKFLRNTALDELPQLLNIFTGDMSFVGPRPLLSWEREINDDGHTTIEYTPGYRMRISIRPGLTGFAQVCAPRDIPRRFKFKLDTRYIRNMNFLLDLKLIFISFLVTLTGNWEKSSTKLGVLKERINL